MEEKKSLDSTVCACANFVFKVISTIYDNKATVGIASYLGSLRWKRKIAWIQLFVHALINVQNNTWSLKGISVCSTQ